MGALSAQNPGLQPVPTGQQPPPKAISIPTSVNINPIESAQVWRPSGNIPSPPLATSGQTAVSGQIDSLLPTSNLYPGQTALFNGQLSPTIPPITLSGGLVRNPAVTVAPNGAKPVLTVGKQVFTVAPTGFDISGMSILPGGHTVTVSGTPIFLDASSHLQLGHSIVDPRPWAIFSTKTTSSGTSLDLDLTTSTMTTLPPGFYTEVPKSTTLVGNMWLTTKKDGHSTIVPVVEGTIVWNLPEIPHVSFQFPDFPSIPHFHLPCIKFFGIHISGDCPSLGEQRQ